MNDTTIDRTELENMSTNELMDIVEMILEIVEYRKDRYLKG